MGILKMVHGTYAVFFLVIGAFAFFGNVPAQLTPAFGVTNAEAGCDAKKQSCAEKVQAAASTLLNSMRGGQQLKTTVANCPKVEKLSHKWAPDCRQIKKDCRAISRNGVLTGDCADACALCDIRETFVKRWKSFCDRNGYRS